MVGSPRKRTLSWPKVRWYLARIQIHLRVLARRRDSTEADYISMQQRFYESGAQLSRVKEGEIVEDFVVGTASEHDQWADFRDYLFQGLPLDASLTALDFGCGPGRNMRAWSYFFARIDGCDISAANLANARVYMGEQLEESHLFRTTGRDCGSAESGAYDVVYSTICLQHIAAHSVRVSIFGDIFRVLRSGGVFTAQMGFGVNSPNTVDYYSNHYSAATTNRGLDVAVTSPTQLSTDLEDCGFIQFKYWIRPTGPGDIHPNWIYFQALRP